MIAFDKGNEKEAIRSDIVVLSAFAKQRFGGVTR